MSKLTQLINRSRRSMHLMFITLGAGWVLTLVSAIMRINLFDFPHSISNITTLLSQILMMIVTCIFTISIVMSLRWYHFEKQIVTQFHNDSNE